MQQFSFFKLLLFYSSKELHKYLEFLQANKKTTWTTNFNSVIDTSTEYFLTPVTATTSGLHINSLRGYTQWLKTNTLAFPPQTEISVEFKGNIFSWAPCLLLIGLLGHVGHDLLFISELLILIYK